MVCWFDLRQIFPLSCYSLFILLTVWASISAYQIHKVFMINWDHFPYTTSKILYFWSEFFFCSGTGVLEFSWMLSLLCTRQWRFIENYYKVPHILNFSTFYPEKGTTELPAGIPNPDPPDLHHKVWTLYRLKCVHFRLYGNYRPY